MLRISCTAEQQLASQEGLCFMEVVVDIWRGGGGGWTIPKILRIQTEREKRDLGRP
jgi:hypothetical protein